MIPHRTPTDTVIPFPPRAAEPPPTRPRPRGQVVALAAFRAALREERDGEEWARLARLADAAWTWRDPESLAALAACVTQLAATVTREWDGEATGS